jgi:hypothetical protein
MTHDYKRNGTTDRFAVLDIATGEVRNANTSAAVWRLQHSVLQEA